MWSMKNAKDALLRHIANRPVKYVDIEFDLHPEPGKLHINGPLTDELLKQLDFEYDNGYGMQYLFGYIWYADGTWSERHEYGGAEGWEHKSCPPLPDSYRDVPL
jgi:hypothetical protein